ncbi:hypothetical protein FYK55_07990 [Roseiconus nitratireducens]|uniref:Uncharacterized protein n=1 Tax=Roseiconus nitratireducens TaxID=2605748 RepID=A0A5M6DDC3_9BACT|nr:hypothetical protein [Roseiconus nitratireducens]KAA5544282.1 hypothetical protein FYK55_07990 [Roseiconus nitratireducens]
MNQKIQLTLACLFALAFAALLSPRAEAGHGKLFDQTGHACCPVCDHVCKLSAEKVEVEKQCFDVEAKVICIPRVVFPWQHAKKAACAACDSCGGRGCSACVHNGARLRKVCVLKTEKYKCPACEYTWTAEKVNRGRGGGCCGGPACDGGCVCDAMDLSGSYPVPPATDLPAGAVITAPEADTAPASDAAPPLEPATVTPMPPAPPAN